MPESYEGGRRCSKLREAYSGSRVPEEMHEAASKESGELAHAERALEEHLVASACVWLRWAEALSFSRSDEMDESCLKLSLHRYEAAMILR